MGLSHPVLGSAAFGLWVRQLVSAPGAHPPKVSGVGALQGFQVWAPSPLIWVPVSRALGEHWGCFSAFTVQGLRGEGRQRLRLLPRFSNEPLSASVFFFFLRNSSYSNPPGPSKHLAAHTAQPGSLPRILQKTLRLAGASVPRGSQGSYCP